MDHELLPATKNRWTSGKPDIANEVVPAQTTDSEIRIQHSVLDESEIRRLDNAGGFTIMSSLPTSLL